MPAYKDEKTKLWMARFYYENHLGERKQKKKRGFKRKSDALEFEREFLLKLNGSPEMAFQTLYDDYIEDMAHRLKETTMAGKKYLYETKILPFFKLKRLMDISIIDVRNWQNWLLTQNNQHGKPLSQTYIKTINNQLSAIFNYAVKYYSLPANPARAAGSIGKKQADGIDFWTIDEFNQAMNYFNEFNQYYFIYHILFYSGIRIGELQALTLSDFNFKTTSITINKSYARLNKRDIISEPKTPKSNRVIPVPDFIFDMLTKYLEMLTEYENTTRLFAYHKSSIIRHFKRAADFTDTKEIRLHDLRHSHASHLIELGVSPVLIQERLGHEDIETTLNTYSHLYPNKQEEITKQLELLKPKLSPVKKTKPDKPL